MKVTREVILDLIPLYLSGDASDDTVKLVESFFESDPEFGKQVKNDSDKLFPTNISKPQKKEIEMKSLIKTKKMIKLRSYLLGFAIFFSLVPFSFLAKPEKAFWLLTEAPSSSMVYATFAVLFWIAYFVIKTKKMIKLRPYLLGFAIFLSLLPFSFLATDEKTYWLFLETPKSALVFAGLGVIFWIVYFVTRKRLQVTGL